MDESDDIKPGSFRPAPESFITETKIPEEIKAEPSSDLVAKYQLFDREVNPVKGVIYHPCSANDCSPSVAFPKSRVIYVELDAKAVETLQREGFEAHHASALEYDPGDVDILIMLNPQISPQIPASHIRKGGFALVNDYHATATELRNNPDFQLRGLIRETKDGRLIYDTDYPEDYWKEIDTEEEFKNAPFDWGSVDYETAASVVEALTGKKENVLAEYRKILENARKQTGKDPLEDSNQEEDLILNHEGVTHVLSPLPRKKGTVDDLFVFERVS